VPEDFHRARRKRDTDAQLREADLARRHHPHVTRGGDHAASGDGVAVDRGQHRPGVIEDSHEGRGQCGQELVHIGRAARQDPLQVDTGGEGGSGPGDHHRRALVQLAQGGRDRLQ
jgi:hypothetical protein